MSVKSLKIFPSFFIRGSTQTFIILHFPLFYIDIFRKFHIILYSEETFNLIFLCTFNNRSYELFDEIEIFYQFWPKFRNKVNYESFNMRTIDILICHYENSSISKRRQFFILFPNLKSHNFDDILNLFIFNNP